MTDQEECINDTEYSYDIDPATGDILDFEAERDD